MIIMLGNVSMINRIEMYFFWLLFLMTFLISDIAFPNFHNEKFENKSENKSRNKSKNHTPK